ncbi:hypothetical protein D915_008361 [Fasciola hepatica]|uniref:Uncharacterized protein n=1 Tax=Fasciola hepatica TaxID=6192 RepID=A0A4E0R5M0_FASHE|nr:hypothetical protein D915_008361 [Fasciola hepatica]
MAWATARGRIERLIENDSQEQNNNSSSNNTNSQEQNNNSSSNNTNASTTGELSDNSTVCQRFNTAFNSNNWLDCAIDQQSVAHELLKSIQRMPCSPPSKSTIDVICDSGYNHSVNINVG